MIGITGIALFIWPEGENAILFYLIYEFYYHFSIKKIFIPLSQQVLFLSSKL